MITSSEAVDILYLYLKGSELFSDPKKPTGELCKGDRKENSKLEDVVINTLGLNRSPVQSGFIYLNLYVKNLDPLRVPDIGSGKNMRDTARLKYLSKLAQKVLEGDNGELWINQDVCFEIESDTIEEDGDMHYASFKIEFTTIK
ncbi:hypothetical protein [Sphingobacterium sp. 2149]|uniref:hypothetical protein n=1 Tax=Sphingobacterium sp. 2149 TaxID=2817763 RepID=UPI0028611323|nr:hypothetical protein [Sphingobacterium sp. 2149]MDR6734173.1 hypothetical protein [Sphingobacterium sp. 2149]